MSDLPGDGRQRRKAIAAVNEKLAALGKWGERLREARQRAGLTLEQLGERLTPQQSRKTISAMELGRRTLDTELCLELSKVLGCSPEWLAGWPVGDEEAM